MNAEELIAHLRRLLEECLDADPGAYTLGQALHERIRVAVKPEPE